MGGYVAAALAARRPDLVGRLALAETPLAFGRGSASRAIAAQTEAEFRSAGFEAFVEEIRAEAGGGDAGMAAFLGAWQVAAPHAVYRSAVGQLRDGPALGDRLRRLPIPRAYLRGARTPHEPAQARLEEALVGDGVEVRVVPEAGHHLHLDNPAGFAAALAGALNPVDDPVDR
jgi:pimeloyl-ACP methyl ester carboxylesterase